MGIVIYLLHIVIIGKKCKYVAIMSFKLFLHCYHQLHIAIMGKEMLIFIFKLSIGSTIRGWQSMTVCVEKEGGVGEGKNWRQWREINGTRSLNFHWSSPNGYIGGQKFFPG